MLLIVSLLLPSLFVSHALKLEVTENGCNNQTCLTGKTGCHTLGYALSVLDDNTHDITITVLYSHKLHETKKWSKVSDISILGVEDDDITITCPDIGTGLSFSKSIDITIEHITWINCAVLHETSAMGNWSNNNDIVHKLILPSAYSALFMYNCTNLILNNAHFSSNRGSGVSLYNVIGVVHIINSTFINHTQTDPPCTKLQHSNCSIQSTGIYIEFMYCTQFETYCVPDKTYMYYTYYNITNCTFERNNNSGAFRDQTDIVPGAGLQHEQHWPFGRGGGLGIIVRIYKIKYFHLHVINNTFKDNVAVFGGGMFLKVQSGYPDHNFYLIHGNNFTNNTAYLGGGGIEIYTDLLYHSKVWFNESFRNYIYLEDCIFTRNEAYWGGGLSFVTLPSNVSFLDFTVESCHWMNNMYSGGGGAVGLLRIEKPEQLLYFTASARFYGCTFSNTEMVLPKSNSRNAISSTVHSEGVQLSFHGHTSFCENSATGLSLSDTGAMFNNSVLFYKNTGYNGGAVCLTGKSWITLVSGVVVNFLQNTAFEYGGAIYYHPPAPLNMNISTSCFVWYNRINNIDVPPLYWTVDVSFTDNTAMTGTGDAAYITDPEQCKWPNEKSLFDSSRTEQFDYSGQNSSRTVIASPAKNMNIVVDNSTCKYKAAENDDDFRTYAMMPGEKLQIKLITTDSIGTTVPSVISIRCQTVDDYKNSNYITDACTDNNSSFKFNGSPLVTSGVVLDLKLGGPLNNTDYLVVFRTNDAIPVTIPLRINFTLCQLGFEYDNNTKQCICVHNSLEDSPVLCTTPEGDPIDVPCVKNHYWYGSITIKNKTQFVYQSCRSGKCKPFDHHQSCGSYHGYFKLPMNDHELCENDLTGPLCSQCNDSTSLTLSYNGYRCIHCKTRHKIALVFLILLECVFIVAVLIAFLKLNIRVSTAGFYGFLYFYSVLPLLKGIELSTTLEKIIAVIISVTSLDFGVLQYIDVCLFDEVRAIHYEVLHYIYPLAILLLIFTIIKIDELCLRRFQFFSGDAAIQALCIILLISYTSISETSLQILLPLRYYNAGDSTTTKEWYVYVDPGVEYMDKKHHLAFWLVALVVELCVVLPYALLMLLAPWIMRCINLTRIKPLLDEYQNCFKDEYRWFAGIYLLARQIMFMISFVTSRPEVTSYLKQLFCLLLLILTASIQPYRNRLLNLIDILILFLLCFLSFSTDHPTAVQLFYDRLSVQQAIIAIISLLPVTCMILAVVINGLWKCIKREINKRFPKRMQSVLGDSYVPVSSGDEQLSYTHEKESENEDLPPRFYDEERAHLLETTNLLGQSSSTKRRTIPRGGARVAVSDSTRYHAITTPSHSVNQKPNTN